jgi:cytidylate kinase
MGMSEQIAITISRQLGSGGSYLGTLLADHLGYRYIDREILKQTSSLLHEDESIISSREEKVTGFWESLVQSLCVCTPETGYSPPPYRHICDKELFDTETQIITNLAAHCNTVIVGRGAFHILRKRPGAVSVFLHASEAFRIRRVMELYSIQDKAQACAMVRESDMQRRKFIQTISGSEWTDARNYQLSIDTEAVGFPAAMEMILLLVKTRQQSLEI